MKKLILILSLSIIALFGFSQTYDAGKQTSFASFTITDLTVDTINAIKQYQYNGTELGLMDNVIYVAETSPVTSTGSFNAPYTSVQTALTASVSGDIVVVMPGTYTGHLTFTEDSVTLISLKGRDQTFLSTTMTANAGIDFVDYISVIDFTITGDAAGALIQLNSGEKNVRILNNLINTSGLPTFGINGGTSGSDSLIVQNNVFKTNAGDGGVYLDKNHSNTIIDHNYFYGSDSTNGYAIQTSGLNVGQFTNNIIEGYASGIFPHTTTTTSSGTSHITISGNIIKECSMAIRLGHSAMTVDMDSILVFNNVCYLNSWGIFIDNAATNLVNTFEIVNNTLNSNVVNYANLHSTLTPNSLSYWDGGNLNTKGSIYNGSTEMIDFSATTVVAVKGNLSIEGSDRIQLNGSSTTNIIFSGGSDNSQFFKVGNNILLSLLSSGSKMSCVNVLPKTTSLFDLGSELLLWDNYFTDGSIYNNSTEIINFNLDDNRLVFKVSLEMSAGDTIWADSMIVQGGVGLKRFKITLADDQSYAFEDATTQMVRIFAIDQDAFINSGNIQSDGTVAVVGTGLISNTDSDGNLCLFKSGTTAILRNRLGLEVDIVVEILKP